VWDINKQGSYTPPTFTGNVMSNNYFAITNLNADGSFYFNQPIWAPQCNTATATCTNNTDGGKATPEMEKQEYQNWLNKLGTNAVTVGPIK